MSILIATPCFNKLALEPYFSAVRQIEAEVSMSGVRVGVLTTTNESLITRGRDVIAATFRNETGFDMLLFIDADIEPTTADVASVYNLCHQGAAVACGAYRHKNPESKRQAWVKGKLEDVSNFSEPFEVDYAGTGFMCIRRDTFDKLEELHPDWVYDEGFPLEEKKEGAMRCVGFFQDPIEDSELGRFKLSEDYFFCKRVREAGMKVMMDPAIELGHWGWYRY